MTAKLISEDATESVKQGYVDLGVDQTWQVVTTARNVPFTTVLLDPDLPALGSSQLFDTQRLWLIDRRPARTSADETGRKWYVKCVWSNNTNNFRRDVNGDPVSDPTDSVKTVDVTFQEYSEPITNATFKSQTAGGGYSIGTDIPQIPAWITANPNGPVRVSTGEVVVAERIAYRQTLMISRIEAEWDATYETYTNALNELQLVVTESDSVGVKATYTYEPLTLRMKPILKQPIWYDAILYYRISFEMEHNPATWVHSEADVSQRLRAFAGQNRLDETTWTQQEIDDLGQGSSFVYLAIKDKDEAGNVVAVGDPAKLNGYGAPLPTPRVAGIVDGDSNVYMNYDVYDIKDYTPLAL